MGVALLTATWRTGVFVAGPPPRFRHKPSRLPTRQGVNLPGRGPPHNADERLSEWMGQPVNLSHLCLSILRIELTKKRSVPPSDHREGGGGDQDDNTRCALLEFLYAAFHGSPLAFHPKKRQVMFFSATATFPVVVKSFKDKQRSGGSRSVLSDEHHSAVSHNTPSASSFEIKMGRSSPQHFLSGCQFPPEQEPFFSLGYQLVSWHLQS